MEHLAWEAMTMRKSGIGGTMRTMVFVLAVAVGGVIATPVLADERALLVETLRLLRVADAAEGAQKIAGLEGVTP